MCIRDRGLVKHCAFVEHGYFIDCFARTSPIVIPALDYGACLLYTSDAADERSSVDLGGRRIIKKKKHKQTQC